MTEPPKKKKVGQFQRDHIRDWRLSQILAPTRRLTRAGKHMKEGSTAASVSKCPGCGCWVVDSKAGREGHAQRMPKCRAALGL